VGQRAAVQAAVGRVVNSSYDSALATGLYRTTVMLRTLSDWARLEKLGVVVLEEIAADEQKNADSKIAPSASFHQSAAIVLADEEQLEALARLPTPYFCAS